MTVQSGVAFVVHGSDTLTCATYRASGTVDSIRGDTVQLREISALVTRAGESPECAALRAGWLVIAGEPTPEIFGGAPSLAKTAGLVAGIVGTAAFVIVVIAIQSAFPKT